MSQAHHPPRLHTQPGDATRVVLGGSYSGQFGLATTTALDALITDESVDLVDIGLPTTLHAEVAVAAMQADNHARPRR